jgi:alpha-beta hydrolase superfamily lysophospholipase
MPTFDGVTGRVYYKVWRCPAQASIVFLHGFGEHSGLYHRLGNTLVSSGINLWALDEIGHGLTAGERAVIQSADDLVDNARRLVALAEADRPGQGVWLAGHSLGAVAAALTAVREPRRFAGLILSGAAASPLDWVIGLGQEGAGELSLNAEDLSSDPFYLDELEFDPLAFTSAAGGASLAAVLPPAWAELASELPRLELPVLIVHGEQDPVVPVEHARAWAGRIARARLAEFPGARHDVLNETVHQQVAAAISEFVLSGGELSPAPDDAAGVVAQARAAAR